ncbi:hypothetical protein AB0912_15375 [Streptomyces sp. NPDC007084]|uniref:hypothetical protein n=1 Tax=Streptomyces sp. NPDC007084 TaxID=3154313 RepID=UPI0034520DD3
MAAHLLVPYVDDLVDVIHGLHAAADCHCPQYPDPAQAAKWRRLANAIGDATDRLPAPPQKGASE